ncbi:vomeronasal type-2 receptor 26-like [Xenopus tropicalis]|uniref:Vomeronasal type-2 receptor 26-like n=1 Tax=Xenopus tropicalis TaxID=8364 RepID=A0A8J1IPW0_XENTR|nr:vomeronasal type-2 receptor 26-like [Xenopus tropicalis]
MYAIEEINNSTELLPNITLGYRIYDTCTSEKIALMSTFSLLFEDENPTVNYICQQDQKLVAFVGHLLSSITYTIAEITQLYGYPQISYGALDPVFNDRINFPSVYRTVPNEYSQFRVIIKLLKHFGWTWVGIIASDDKSNYQASQELRKEMEKNRICVDFLKSIANSPPFSHISAFETIEVIKDSSVRVIILYFSISSLTNLLSYRTSQLISERVFICSVALDIVIESEFTELYYLMNGSLLIALPRGDIPGLNDFLSYKLWTDSSENIFLQTVFDLIAECSDVVLDGVKNVTCLKKHRIKEYLLQEETITHRIKHTIYMAVYALAHALDNMQLPIELWSSKEMSKIRFKLNYYLKNLHLKTPSGEEFFFSKEGNIPGKFDILNWIINENGTINKIHVGKFLPSSDRLIIDETAITWAPYFEKTSQCSEMCSSGQRRAHQNGRPPCCFDCVSCSEGEISNSADVETCVKCAEDQWPNPTRDQCIIRVIDYLSYEDLLGYILSGCASVFTVLNSAVLLVFIKHRRTPIVRANNQNISYILLMALLMSFLCTFMFIGQPTGVTCMLRQTTVMFVLSIAISSMLGKTLMVLAAFQATKMEKMFRKLGRINISVGVVFLCSFVELIICVIWLSLYPPHVESDNKTVPGKIILQCNEGSIISFYLAVSYIGVLSLISFAVAFIARKLPDRFNEAQHITFSMLVFCSVWVSFIPTYLSTKGKHMVAVEIFAIQASAAGLLMCIFTPKCYIILLKPELNVKGKPRVTH